MAYKFQIGAARLSGSLTQEGNITSTGNVDIVNNGTIGAGTDADMLTLTQADKVEVASDVSLVVAEGKLELGDGNAVTATAAELNLLDGVSGLVQADFTKLAAIDATDAEIDAVCDNSAGGDHEEAIANGDFIMFRDGGITGDTKFEAIADVATLFAGGGLIANNSVIAVDISGSLALGAGASGKLGISGSLAGIGLKYDGGVNSISELALDLNELNAATVNVANDSIAIIDADASNESKKESIADLVDAVAGSGIASASGVMSIANATNGGIDVQSATLAVDIGNLAAAVINVAADDIAFADADGGTKKESIVDFVAGVQSTGLAASAGQLSVAAAQTSITSLLATDIKIGEDDQTKIDFETPDEIHFYAANAEQVYVADGIFGPQTDSDVDLGSTSVRWKDLYVDSATITGDVTLGGNLTVQGTTTTIDSTTINVSSSFTFEGPADAHETTLHAGGDGTGAAPSADTTLYLAAVAAGNYYLPAFSDSSINSTVIAATATELNILDGGSSDSSVTIVNADQIIINDGGTMKQTAVSDLKTYIEDGLNPAVSVALKADGDTLAAGINYFADMGSDGEDAVTLPASPSVGQSVKVKAPSDCGEARYITINRAGSQTIDGETSIRLESPFAAVELVYVDTNLWRVF